jgi:hypothetical protein
MAQDKTAAQGKVKTHVNKISLAFAQCTARGCSEAPMPMMAVLTTCVVETGPPNKDAPKITPAEVN